MSQQPRGRSRRAANNKATRQKANKNDA